MDSAVNLRLKDNLTFVEQVLMLNLSATEISANLSNQDVGDRPGTSSGSDQVKIIITDIEISDKGYTAEDQLPTLSRILSTRVRYLVRGGDGEDSERHTNWVIKIPPLHREERQLSKQFDVARREISFYSRMLPLLEKYVQRHMEQPIRFNTPVCYFGKFLRPNDNNPAVTIVDHILDSESLLVLEDLSAEEFGKSFFGKGMTIPEVLATIEEITKFHAVTYAVEKRTGKEFLFDEMLHWRTFIELYKPLFQRGSELLENYVKQLPEGKGHSSILKSLEFLRENFDEVLTEILKPGSNIPCTLIHMDLWSDNLLFRTRDDTEPLEDAEVDCCILDWQLVSRGCPAIDIGMLMCLSMDPDTRREYCLTLLQVYYSTFEQILLQFNLDMPFGFDALMREYYSACMLALITAISSSNIALSQESCTVRLFELMRDLIEDGLLPK